MIPIRDINRSETRPVVNYLLIAVNVCVFFVQMAQGNRLNAFIYTYGLVPARYSVPDISAHFTTGQQLFSFLSFMFLHGGFLHLLGNMWFLYIFGDNVEDRLGHLRYLFFYLLCGLASGISHVALNWGSEIPTIGASGAIAGVMGAYLILFPRAKILTLIPIFFFLQFVEVPALVFLGFWFLIQFLSATATPGHGGGIAWWAHIGGFLFGIVLLKLLQGAPSKRAGGRRQVAGRKRNTPRLQVIRPSGGGDTLDLYGAVHLNEREAIMGARKMVNIAHGLKKRTFMVNIPQGISDGTTLRLRGMGRESGPGLRGDLYLKVQIRE